MTKDTWYVKCPFLSTQGGWGSNFSQIWSTQLLNDPFQIWRFQLDLLLGVLKLKGETLQFSAHLVRRKSCWVFICIQTYRFWLLIWSFGGYKAWQDYAFWSNKWLNRLKSLSDISMAKLQFKRLSSDLRHLMNTRLYI